MWYSRAYAKSVRIMPDMSIWCSKLSSKHNENRSYKHAEIWHLTTTLIKMILFLMSWYRVEVKVIPHCPFWVFPIVNAVSKKSSLSHPFDGFPHVTARFTECFFINYDIEIVEIIAFCWWAAILLNAKRYSRKITSAWQRWENISWTGRSLLVTSWMGRSPGHQQHIWVHADHEGHVFVRQDPGLPQPDVPQTPARIGPGWGWGPRGCPKPGHAPEMSRARPLRPISSCGIRRV